MPRTSIHNTCVTELLESDFEASLIIADPPWSHKSYGFGNKRCGRYQYESLSLEKCRDHLALAVARLRDPGYLMLWSRFVILPDWFEIHGDIGAKYVSGGAWVKTNSNGLGYHWRGVSEPLLLYKKGRPKPQSLVLNGSASPRKKHSEKPVEWQTKLIEAFCPPEGTVLDMYAGLGSAAVACELANRNYIGAEIDPERYKKARKRLKNL